MVRLHRSRPSSTSWPTLAPDRCLIFAVFRSFFSEENCPQFPFFLFSRVRRDDCAVPGLRRQGQRIPLRRAFLRRLQGEFLNPFSSVVSPNPTTKDVVVVAFPPVPLEVSPSLTDIKTSQTVLLFCHSRVHCLDRPRSIAYSLPLAKITNQPA